MKYMGGKHRQGKTIAKYVKMVLNDGVVYVEPFCGAMGVAYRVNHQHMILSDISKSLMNMWIKFQDLNFELPDVVTEDEYNEAKSVKGENDWRTAYYGFGLSFGGKWYGGYSRDNKGVKDEVTPSRRAKQRTDIKRKTIFKNNVKLVCSSYNELNIPPNSVIYCDPPYKNRTKAHNFESFDYDKFWEWCRKMASDGHIILVTEFTSPDDFKVLHSFGDTVVRHYASLGADGTNESLLCHESQYHLFVES